MSRSHDVGRFDDWAHTYDRHWMQRAILEPVQGKVLEVAAKEVPQPKTILDVGCGTGKLLRSSHLRFPDAELFGVDPAPEMISQASAAAGPDSAISFQVAAAEDLPFPAARFDLVFSTLTFHHWRDQAKAAAEIAHVMAPAGCWLLADFVPFGILRHLMILPRLRRFPALESLSDVLTPVDLRVVGQARVQGLLRQLAVLVIRSRDRESDGR